MDGRTGCRSRDKIQFAEEEEKNIERKTDHSAEANRIISINHENMPRVPEERRACALITAPVAPDLFKDVNGQAEEFQQTLRNEYDV